ncbi:hypothetical protein Cgig2_000016 [Carnegiea gigantea]|uniref:Uncharacterized protein n=1 Tax=Carnegiea gigantea TaxID=171969 RepID=A0A9Q1QS26_9CARY|nr:hypothetical protein Cgig2_000016 [Carnegiea gigantea]
MNLEPRRIHFKFFNMSVSQGGSVQIEMFKIQRELSAKPHNSDLYLNEKENNGFFYASIAKRHYDSSISEMQTKQGCVTKDKREIGEILDFLEVASPGMSPCLKVILQGRCLTAKQQTLPLGPVTVVQIKHAMFSIGNCKSPRLDGFGGYFSKNHGILLGRMCAKMSRTSSSMAIVTTSKCHHISYRTKGAQSYEPF